MLRRCAWALIGLLLATPTAAFAQQIQFYTRESTLTLQPDENERRPAKPSNLTGTTFAVSLGGEPFSVGGSHLRLPADVEGWEDNIDLGIGVYSPMGEFGHMGLGVGAGDDDDVAVQAHLAMRW